LIRIQDKNSKTHCFRVRDREGLFKIISILNGNIFLATKKEQFKLWLEAYNKKYKENIIYLEDLNKPTLDNSWLCGFTDAEGCFTCSITDNIDKPKRNSLVRLRYILSQKSNLDQMKYLAEMLNGKTYYLKSYDGYNVTINTTKLSLVINYFSNFSLKTKKFIVYFNWLKIYKLVINKKHLTNEGLDLIKKYKKNLNRLDMHNIKQN